MAEVSLLYLSLLGLNALFLTSLAEIMLEGFPTLPIEAEDHPARGAAIRGERVRSKASFAVMGIRRLY